ncbi:MAG: polyphosphate kinase 1 [Bacteroidetes bacterium]|nr:polyphosphate kinase 1 [Bacteroidota bacterium]
MTADFAELGMEKLFNRELSWLSFNQRVLQEAKDKTNPVLERLKFLAIYSSNLDEFYRVRVAGYRSLVRLGKKTKSELDFSPKKILKRIRQQVGKQQQEFGRIYREELVPEMAQNKIQIVDQTSITLKQKKFVQEYFKKEVLPELDYVTIKWKDQPLFLENKSIYIIVRVITEKDKERDVFRYVIIKIPSDRLKRFLVLPDPRWHTVMFLDDVIRTSFEILFTNKEVMDSYSIKLSRDAELYIEDEFSGNVVQKIRNSLRNRLTGLPARFLYDSNMPPLVLTFVKELFRLRSEDLIPGGVHHNLDDFFSFPGPDIPELYYPEQEVLPHPGLEAYDSMFTALRSSDHLVHYPYQSFDYVLRLLNEAAQDPDVRKIQITLYRIATDSKVAAALIEASNNGKKVIVFDEVQARFDEHANLFWGEELSKSGVRVIYSHEGLKVHSKILMISRKEEGRTVDYCYLSTGNFNENTAKIYTDQGLFTSDRRFSKDLKKVFDYLGNINLEKHYDHLLVAPHFMREEFEKLIDREIMNAKAGKKAVITVKINSLEDKLMIQKLLEAGRAGVKIKMVVRGICCLIPGVDDVSINIKIISIVGRYLEHSRIFIFHNDGDKKVFLSSADWMSRNLVKRVEVCFPIYDPLLKKEVIQIMNVMFKDNVKARAINITQSNPYKLSSSSKKVTAQLSVHHFLKFPKKTTSDEKNRTLDTSSS